MISDDELKSVVELETTLHEQTNQAKGQPSASGEADDVGKRPAI